MNADFEVDESDLKVYRNFVEGGMDLGMVVFELEDLMAEMVIVDFSKNKFLLFKVFPNLLTILIQTLII